MPRENPALIRQIDACRIDQIDDRHPVSHRDFLRSEDLFDRFGIPSTCFDRRVIRHHDGFPAINLADERYNSGGRCLAVVLVISNEQSDLLAESVGVEQQFDPFAGRQLALSVDLLDLLRPAAELEFVLKAQIFVGERLEARFIFRCFQKVYL